MRTIYNEFGREDFPDERREKIAKFREIISSDERMKHALPLVEKILEMWGTKSIYSPAMSDKDIVEFAKSSGYKEVSLSPSTTEYGNSFYHEYSFEFKKAENKPDMSGKFTYRDIDIDLTFKSGSEFHHELQIDVGGIYEITVSHIDGIGKFDALPGTRMTIAEKTTQSS
jgi:hypothetical protein